MANDVNRIVIAGRLTRDCGSDPNDRDFIYTQGGTCIAKVSIAVNRSQKQGDQWVDVASFFNVTIFGKTAENLKPYMTKGKQIVVDGHLQQDRWTDQQRQNHSAVSIVADNVQLVGGQSQNNNGYQQPQPTQNPQFAQPQYQQNPAPQNQPYQQPNYPPPTNGDDFSEEIPF